MNCALLVALVATASAAEKTTTVTFTQYDCGGILNCDNQEDIAGYDFSSMEDCGNECLNLASSRVGVAYSDAGECLCYSQNCAEIDENYNDEIETLAGETWLLALDTDAFYGDTLPDACTETGETNDFTYTYEDDDDGDDVSAADDGDDVSAASTTAGLGLVVLAMLATVALLQ